jgi:dTDP-4-amino-4,6-dideoxygalactose transaminase
MEDIIQIARKSNLFVVEDCAQATGAVYKFSDGRNAHAGTIGDLGTTSFFPSKNLGCFGDGGAILTNSDDLAQMCRSIANHGMKVRYYHDHVGINSRLDSIQAAILSVKLNHLNAYNEARQKAAAYYDQVFAQNKKITIPFRDIKSSHIFHQYTLVLNGVDREEFKKFLQIKGIPTMIYYPVPLHLQNAYRHLGYKEGDFPITEKLCKTVISLPMHTELDDEQLNHITSSFLDYLK